MKRKPKGLKYRNLFARGDVIYYRRLVGKRRIKLSTKTSNWEEAAAFRDLYEREKGIGRLPFLPDDVPTFAELAERYLKQGTAHLAETTRDDRRYLLAPTERLVARFGQMPVDEIRKRHLLEWWNTEVEGRVTWKTGKNHLDCISAVLGLAADYEWIETNPCDEFRATLRRRRRTKSGRAGSEPSKDVKPIEAPEKITKLLGAAAEVGQGVHLVVLLMLDAGLRFGEVQGLRWSDVEWGSDRDDTSRCLWIEETKARGQYLGKTKSGRARSVDLSRRLRRALREWQIQQEARESRVLPELDQSNFRKRAFRRICREAELVDRSPKDLRDTFASWLLTLTGDLGYVSAQLGHSDPQVTVRHYTRWIPTVRRGRNAQLDEGELPPDLLAALPSEARLKRQAS